MAEFLSIAHVKACARQAYDEGRLTAQMPPKDSACVYSIESDGVEYVCAIGASMTKEIRRDYSAHGSVRTLYAHKIIESDDIPELHTIQKYHDSWLSIRKLHMRKICSDNDAKKAEKRFLESIE